MVNIVLDTNSWLYLCNGYDQETNKHQSGLHFKLLAELSSLVERGAVRLFVNEVIIKEFKRNRDVAENHIKKMEASLKGKADFFKNDQYEDSGDTIFVSNNSDDYCVSKGSKEVHPDLQPYFQSSGITFELNIGKALNLSQELIAQVEAYNDYMDTIGYCVANCEGHDLGTAIVVYDAPIAITVDNTTVYRFNPDQLQLDFPVEFKITEADIEEANSKNRVLLELGFCQHCNASHVRCECGAINYNYGEVEFECDCGMIIYQDEEGEYCVAREWPEDD